MSKDYIPSLPPWPSVSTSKQTLYHKAHLSLLPPMLHLWGKQLKKGMGSSPGIRAGKELSPVRRDRREGKHHYRARECKISSQAGPLESSSSAVWCRDRRGASWGCDCGMRLEGRSVACGATLLWEFTWHCSALPVPLHEKILEESVPQNGKSAPTPCSTPRVLPTTVS